MRDAPDPFHHPQAARGAAATLAAYAIWGAVPLYFKLVGRWAGAPEVLTHRILWSVLLIAFLVVLLRRGQAWASVAAESKNLPVYVATTLLISSNWLLYIWAVNAGRVVEASLGYYINPLFNVLLAVVFLRERLSRLQLVSISFAGAGVLSLLISHGSIPWVALTLGGTFAVYGLLRKKAAIDPLVGIGVETALLAPAAAAWLGWLAANGQAGFLQGGPGRIALFALAGVVTAVPLVLFAFGAQRLRLSTVGLMQYLSPTLQLVVGVFVFGEPFGAGNALAFGLIWGAVALYSWDAIAASKTARPIEQGAAPPARP